MTTEVNWDDGSGEKIYLTYGAAEETQIVSVSSDPNTRSVSRTKDITFSIVSGGVTINRILTVSQNGASQIVYYDWLRNEDVARITLRLNALGVTAAKAKITIVAELETLNGYMMSGSYSSSLGQTTFFMYLNSSNKMSYRFGSQGYTNPLTKVSGVKYKYVYNIGGYNQSKASSIYIYNADTGQQLYTKNNITAYLNSDLALFSYAVNTGGKDTAMNYSLPCVGKLYSFKIEQDDVVKIDLRPCAVNGVGGMIDMVSGQIYYNDNTSGSFTFGNNQ